MTIKLLSCPNCGSGDLKITHLKQRMWEPELWTGECITCYFEMPDIEGDIKAFIEKWNSPLRVVVEVPVIEVK